MNTVLHNLDHPHEFVAPGRASQPVPDTGGDQSLLAYQIVGSGPPLLMIHGFGISFSIWSHLLPHLTPHFQCILVELPGIGTSPDPDADRPYYDQCVQAIERLRHHLRLERWSIFAYSTGSRAAERYIVRYPDRVARVVMLCPLYLRGWRWALAKLLFRVDAVLPDLGTWALSGSRLRLLVRILGFNGQSHPGAKAWSAEIGRQKIDTLKRTLRDLPSAGRTLLELPAPVLYLWGIRDLVPQTPRRQLRRRHAVVHRRIPATHSAPQLAAAAIAAEAVPFLAAENGVARREILERNGRYGA